MVKCLLYFLNVVLQVVVFEHVMHQAFSAWYDAKMRENSFHLVLNCCLKRLCFLNISFCWLGVKAQSMFLLKGLQEYVHHRGIRLSLQLFE